MKEYAARLRKLADEIEPLVVKHWNDDPDLFRGLLLTTTREESKTGNVEYDKFLAARYLMEWEAHNLPEVREWDLVLAMRVVMRRYGVDRRTRQKARQLANGDDA